VRADAADIDDLVQSFFERLVGRDYHILKLWQRGTSLPIYLSTVIRNFIFDFYRSKNLRQKREEFVGGLSELELKESSVLERDQRKRGATLKREEITPLLELKELRRFGLQAWAKLEFRDRVLMCGKLHRELSNEAMAVRLKLTEGALRTALFRAQGRLLAGLKTLAPEYFPA
jgi:RNA polymerase sigma factor (sigma-70 family)